MVRDVDVAGVPVRVYRPAVEGLVPTVIFAHGGGWMIGDLDTHDAFARRLCRDARTAVVAVHYRRIPEHPFPAGYEDCLAVARHVADHPGEFGGGVTALAGDEVGARAVAGVALAFRDEQRELAAQLLLYPAVDLSPSAASYPSMDENATGYGLTTAEIARLRGIYLSEQPDAGESAPASPLRAKSHKGLAPAIIAVAEFDPLRDQGLAYADALAAAGVPVKRHVYEGLPHAFIVVGAVVAAVDAAITQVISEFEQLIHVAQ
jgi:acetyl esterase